MFKLPIINNLLCTCFQIFGLTRGGIAERVKKNWNHVRTVTIFQTYADLITAVFLSAD